MSKDQNKIDKILDAIQDEALRLLSEFKKHPIKSIILAILILWGVKIIYKIIRS